MSKPIAYAAVIAVAATSSGLSQALASPSATTANPSLSRQIAGLAHRLSQDEGTIHRLGNQVQALQARRLSVNIRTGTTDFGTYGTSEKQALCGPGETVVGGGAGWGSNGGSNINDRLILSQPDTYPDGSGAGWIAVGVPGAGELQPFEVYALCAQ